MPNHFQLTTSRAIFEIYIYIEGRIMNTSRFFFVNFHKMYNRYTYLYTLQIYNSILYLSTLHFIWYNIRYLLYLSVVITYHIHLDTNIQPKIDLPRRVPLKIYDKLESELKDMVNMKVIEKVNPPTSWVKFYSYCYKKK